MTKVPEEDLLGPFFDKKQLHYSEELKHLMALYLQDAVQCRIVPSAARIRKEEATRERRRSQVDDIGEIPPDQLSSLHVSGFVGQAQRQHAQRMQAHLRSQK